MQCNLLKMAFGNLSADITVKPESHHQCSFFFSGLSHWEWQVKTPHQVWTTKLHTVPGNYNENRKTDNWKSGKRGVRAMKPLSVGPSVNIFINCIWEVVLLSFFFLNVTLPWYLTVQSLNEGYCCCQLQVSNKSFVNTGLPGLFVLVLTISTTCCTCNTIPTLLLFMIQFVFLRTGHFVTFWVLAHI